TTPSASSTNSPFGAYFGPDGRLWASSLSSARVSVFGTIPAAPTVTTLTQTAITSSAATLGGNVTSDGGAAITERGVVYSSTNSDPLIGGSGVLKATTTGTTGVFTVAVSSLTQATGYSYKAYATNSVNTTYTSVDTFTTLANLPTVTTDTQ